MICRGQKKCTRQKASLPSARKKHSAKTYFAVCFCLPSVFYLALGKHGICRVPDKIHSAKPRHSANHRFPVVRPILDGCFVLETCDAQAAGQSYMLGQVGTLFSLYLFHFYLPRHLYMSLMAPEKDKSQTMSLRACLVREKFWVWLL